MIVIVLFMNESLVLYCRRLCFPISSEAVDCELTLNSTRYAIPMQFLSVYFVPPPSLIYYFFFLLVP